MTAARVAALALAVLAAACVKPASSFSCDTSDQCTVGGTCQPATGFCSFADPACATGQRYGDAAGELSNVCVGDEPVDAPEQIDGPPGQPDGQPDGMPDAGPTCTAPFVESGFGCHAFFQPMTADYAGGRAFCQGMAADLSVLETVEEGNYIATTVLPPTSSQRVLIGLDNLSGAFDWIDGSPLTVTNWSPGEPGGGEDIGVLRPDGLWAGRASTELFYVVCEQ